MLKVIHSQVGGMCLRPNIFESPIAMQLYVTLGLALHVHVYIR